MCEIVIDRIEGANYDPELGIFTAINVVGRVTGCPATSGEFALIGVTVDRADADTRQEVVEVLTHGDMEEVFVWTAHFKDIPCGVKAEVKARCIGGGEDCVTTFDGEMICDARLCPVITVDAIEDQGCDEGDRLIEITVTVQGPPLNQLAVWQYGDDNTEFSEFSNSNQTTVVLAYTPQDLDHTGVVFTLDPDCEYPIEVPEDLLGGCDLECPDVTIESIEDGGCDADGNRVVRITAEVTGPAITGYVLWHYGADRQGNTYLDGENVIEAELLYSDADLEEQGVTLEITPDCTYDLTVPRNLLSACPQPEEEEEEEEVEEDHGGGGPGEEEEEEEEEEEDHAHASSCLCLAWLILNVLLTIATGVAVIVAGCAPNPISIGIAAGLFIVTTVSWLFFWLMCLLATGDCDLARWASFLLDMLASAATIAAIIFGVITAVAEITIGCFIGALITWGYYSLLALWFKNVVIMMRCYDGSSYLPWED